MHSAGGIGDRALKGPGLARARLHGRRAWSGFRRSLAGRCIANLGVWGLRVGWVADNTLCHDPSLFWAVGGTRTDVGMLTVCLAEFGC